MRRGRGVCPVSGAVLRPDPAASRRTVRGAPSTSKISTALTMTPRSSVEAMLPMTLHFWSYSVVAHVCRVMSVIGTFVCPSQLMSGLVRVSICQDGQYNCSIYVAVAFSMFSWGVPAGPGVLLEGGSQMKPRPGKLTNCVYNLLCFRPRLSGLVMGLEFSGVWKILVLASYLSLDQSVTFMLCVEFLKHVSMHANIMAYPRSPQLCSPIAVAFFGSSRSVLGLVGGTSTNLSKEASRSFVLTVAVGGCPAQRSPEPTHTACVGLGRLPLPEPPLQLHGNHEPASQTPKLWPSFMELCRAPLAKRPRTSLSQCIARDKPSSSRPSTTPLPRLTSTIYPMRAPRAPQICQGRKPTSKATGLSSGGGRIRGRNCKP